MPRDGSDGMGGSVGNGIPMLNDGGNAGSVGRLRPRDGSDGMGGRVGNGIPIEKEGGNGGNVGSPIPRDGSDGIGKLKLQLLITSPWRLRLPPEIRPTPYPAVP